MFGESKSLAEEIASKAEPSLAPVGDPLEAPEEESDPLEMVGADILAAVEAGDAKGIAAALRAALDLAK